MTITLIGSLVFKNGSFGIGNNGDLLHKIPNDLRFFKTLTEGNTVIMGYKTWLSLPEKNRPLKNRKNIVLTKNHKEENEDVVFTTFENLKKRMSKHIHYFVIGGAEIYSLFLQDSSVIPDELVLNHIMPDVTCEIDTYLNPDLIGGYEITGFSEKILEDNLSYRYIYFKKRQSIKHPESKYLDLIQEIVKSGNQRIDRTSVGTLSLFGKSVRFNIEHSIPLMTSKRVSFKNILEELLWFCRGETDSNILKDKGVNIWNGNSSREFLDSRNLNHYKEGECGPIYGHQWRRFGQRHGESGPGVDQLAYVENLLKNDPYSRRIVLSAWNPQDLDKMALLPCHMQVQWYVEDRDSKKFLNCMFTMRSSDFALAGCYNIVSYSILTYILAKRNNMFPGEIVYSAGDCHIYSNHLDAINEQMKRNFRPFPCLNIDESIKHKKWEEMEASDFELVGYFPNSSIKMKMAV
jgi:dihydrofolate reductase/thymidylate synthase